LEKSPVALPKVDKLSYNQLIELKDHIEATIEQRRADEQAALKEKMAEMAAEAGFDLEDVLPAKRGGKGRKGGTVAPKYRNPKDPSQTWTGRGRQPKWLVAELEKGRKLESFLIQ
jgi:DNA-binding protein H-NS